MLNKVKKISLKEIKTTSGNIIKYIDKEKNFFKKFGEIYFSEIKKGYVKGWNLHKKCHCLITVPFGSVEFTLMNFKKSKKKRVRISRKKPEILLIPPLVWFKFKSKSQISVVANLINLKHDPKETLKMSIK